MANLVYTEYLTQLQLGAINISSDTIRALIVDTSTTAGTEPEAVYVSDITTLGEYSATNYARLTLASKTITTDTVNHRSIFSSAALVWTNLGVPVTPGQGIVFYKFGTTDADSLLICYKEPAGWPLNSSNGDVTVNPAASGWYNIKQGV